MADKAADSAYDLAPEGDSAGVKRTALPGNAVVAARGASSKEQRKEPERVCPYCGFTFVGKPRARCPECSAEMDSSTNALLQFADAAWVRGVGLGVLLMGSAIAMHMAGCILKWINTPAKGIAHAAAGVLLVAGVFLATRREKGASGGEGHRWGARLMASVALVVWGIFLLWALGKIEIHTGMFKALIALVLMMHGGLAILFGYRLEALALRVPDDAIASHVLTAGWLTAGVCALIMVLQLLDIAALVMLFMFSFPLIAAFVLVLGWSTILAAKIGMNIRAAAEVGEGIAMKRMQRQASRQKPVG